MPYFFNWLNSRVSESPRELGPRLLLCPAARRNSQEHMADRMRSRQGWVETTLRPTPTLPRPMPQTCR